MNIISIPLAQRLKKKKKKVVRLSKDNREHAKKCGPGPEPRFYFQDF